MFLVLILTSLPVYFTVFAFYQSHQQVLHMMMKGISTFAIIFYLFSLIHFSREHHLTEKLPKIISLLLSCVVITWPTCFYSL